MPEPLPSKQSNRSRSSANENAEPGFHSRKRKHSITNKNDVVPKRLCEDSELLSDLQDEFRQDSPDGFHNSCQNNQYRNNIPDTLIRLMYQLDLSVLCTLRKSAHEHKYASTSLAFGDSEIDKFSDIVLRYEEKSIHLHIETVDKYYVDNDIGYAGLFIKEKEKRRFYINDYFDSFVKCLMLKLDSSLNNIEHLIIYTNSRLDLTEEKKLKRGRSRNFYPIKFDNMNIKKHYILKDFFFIKDNVRKRGFYQFSRDKIIREELIKRLELSAAMQKAIATRTPCQGFERKIREAFLDKLVFAVNQPNREELNSLIRNKMKENYEVQDNYKTLRKRILRTLAVPGKHKKIRNYVSRIVYEFSLLMSFLHDMFLHKNMFSINFEGQSRDISNDIIINYRNRITYVKARDADKDIDYSKLFPSKQKEENTFSINKHFALFVEELQHGIRYFIIYTNANLMLTEEKTLKNGKPEDFCPLKFVNIDIQKKRYKILRNCTCINGNDLYKFAQEETTRENVLNLLKLPPFLQKEKEEGCLSNENEKEIKVKFLDRLIFAVNQHDKKKLKSVIRNEVNKFDVPYNHEELREITLRWLESHEFGHITKGMMEKLLEDIKNNRSSYQKTQNRDINEEINFAKTVVGRQGTSTFHQFLNYLIKGEGKRSLEVLKRNGIVLTSMSSILSRSGGTAIHAFKGLYNLWFDEKEDKTRYLQTLERVGVNLATMSGILSGAANSAVSSFKGLYDLWFNKEGNKTQYLKTLEKEGLKLTTMSSILNRAGITAPTAFKDLYDLWFDQKGNKTLYLTTLEKGGINLVTMSSILSGAGSKASTAFKDLYDLWFDEKGNKTQYLKTLEKEGINLANMSSMLNGAGVKAPMAFKQLYDLWFDAEGNKTHCLKTLEKEGINLANMSSILSRAAANASKAFKGLYDLWFDAEGNKTQYLRTLEKEGIKLGNMSSILHGAGANASKAFKDLYDIWFDEEGNKTQYLKPLKEEGINLTNMSSILSRAGANAAKAFEVLYDLWFDEEGNKTQHLKVMEEKGMNLTNVSSILGGAGSNAAKAFKDLCDLWFDEEGNKTKYLEALEENGINLANMSSILHKAGSNASKAFKCLHDLWFDKNGNKTQSLKALEENGINLTNISSILNGAGFNAAKAFKELYNTFCDEEGNKKEHLKHFIKRKGFTIHNLSGILSGTGANVKDAFEKLHDVFFNDDGERTELLDDFYKVGFVPSNLSAILCGTGVRASSILKRLHSVCFNKERERTKLLDDFYKANFSPGALCSILSGTANSLEEFYNFCFIAETQKYLSHFLNEKEGFTASGLCKILHGARTNICSALKDFHDVCFDEEGNRAQLLDDFYNAGFRPSDLSNILCLAGNRATFILRNFHKFCFNKENYLDHFLAEKELFTPKNLSMILDGVGINICPIFEKLHNLCFDKAGNKTKYLKNLINKGHKKNEMCKILHKAVRASSISLNDEEK
ncbi:uncharacterized protein LOC114878166 isoform X1 [Osmia bicornis bicornis]|uniref:uncharacterized protein LOC114878166 isoform X1 n=1 Tax=Osmia bicornis bicornis TaxID=1437191 RepID=UPI001EAF196F|nr:uncharacterized protein LOC114878166 isoform X1 [Osmia bicornis bicornis]